MSRIGQKPITIPSGVTATLKGGKIEVVGPKGKLEVSINPALKVQIEGGDVIKIEEGKTYLKGLTGLNRTLIQNAVTGVTTPWTKSLELVGVGFRATTTGQELNLSLGFSHPIKLNAPLGVTFTVTENKITVSGVDKYVVGEIAAKVRRLKPPEPYKGKGIKYIGEFIRKKAGKATKALGGAPGGK